MATHNTIKDWFLEHTEPLTLIIDKMDHAFLVDDSDGTKACDVEESFRTLDNISVLSMPVMPVQWHSVSQTALTWTMLVHQGCQKIR
ncbi:hypothetical protein [Veillonella tobetsuensis]|jgi:hypothetical protein|uniref:Uncharacterized protein n=1 Tax=Veillonella tobetsuensis TaxID=1110546 RepID=A0A480B0G0_9FIRM|nr:hypothetical protein [Veillonella tobetsuensis]GCL67103.1 hypothetical protein PAGU1578_07240 [Veillonella tobetsuensis]